MRTNLPTVNWKPEPSFQDWAAKNTDLYGARIMSYASDWAALMQLEMKNRKSISDCAKATGTEADTDGISGFMYDAAVQVLTLCWINGESLRLWHNTSTQNWQRRSTI